MKSKAVERSKQNFLIHYSLIISESMSFKALMILSIIGNAICLMFDSHPFNLEEVIIFEKMNLFFGCLYLFEMCISLLSYGVKEYLKYNSMNVFDTLIVVLSLVDICVLQYLIMDSEISLDSSISMTLIRASRILRIFKFARYWR